MENANHGDNIFLTHPYKLLSGVHYSKDLNVGDIQASPTPATWECVEMPFEVLGKHRSRGGSRTRRSRSSPVRSCFSGSGSPETRARSPSVSLTRLVLPDQPLLPAPTVLTPHDTLFTHQSTAGVRSSTMSYFSPRPPSTPLYIVPLAPNPDVTSSQITKLIHSQRQSKTRDKIGRKIARQLLDSLLKKLPINSEDLEVKTVVAVQEPDVCLRSNRSIATQALSKDGIKRKFLTDEEKECSTSESSDGCEWSGSVRALRDSHVRLVLRQLRHLRDIERLSRALRREHAHE